MKRATHFGYPGLREGDLILLTIALLRAVGLAKHFRITQKKATSPRMVHVLPLETSRVEGPPAALPILDFQGFSCKWLHTRHTPLTIQCLSQSQKSKDLPSPKRESLQIFHHLEAPQVPNKHRRCNSSNSPKIQCHLLVACFGHMTDWFNLPSWIQHGLRSTSVYHPNIMR